jgi:hypothetical protein
MRISLRRRLNDQDLLFPYHYPDFFPILALDALLVRGGNSDSSPPTALFLKGDKKRVGADVAGSWEAVPRSRI